MTGADQYEHLPADATARWAKFGKSETVFYPMLLGLDVEETRRHQRTVDRQERSHLQRVTGTRLNRDLTATQVPATGTVVGAWRPHK